MNAQQYFDRYQGQSLLYNQKDPSLRGQCVQSVCYYVAANGRPVIWADAYLWWTNRNAAYEYIVNSPSAVPQPGDIIVWGPGLPGSGGAGHIAVCLVPRPGTGTFISVDQNWGGKTVHQVIHNYDYVVGWLRFKSASPAPAPAPQGGDEMITTAQDADLMYKILRPNSQASQGEIDATVGKRTFHNFVHDAQNEVNQRDANLREQGQHMDAMSQTINDQNKTLAEFTLKLQSSEVSNADKQKALNEALAKLAETNAKLTTTHDKITDLQTTLPKSAEPVLPKKDSLLVKFLAAVLRKKK